MRSPMTLLKRLFHFLGGIYFALLLIALAISFVVLGTVLESKTGSHLLAARWTYAHPAFAVLLSCFFINILFSAMRRWPFRKRHLPFLMTHLGLLMIIAGTLIKNYWGLQGQLAVWEGSGNQHVLLPHTHALYLERKEDHSTCLIPLKSFQRNVYYPSAFPELKCKILGYAPHVKEQWETWIKGPKAYLGGFPSFPIQEWTVNEPFPESTIIPLKGPWQFLALRTPYVTQAMQQAYLSDLKLRLISKVNPENKLEIPLTQAIQASFDFDEGLWTISLDLSDNPEEHPVIRGQWQSHASPYTERFVTPLQGQNSLQVKPDLLSWTMDLERSYPSLYFIEGEPGFVHLFAFDRYGRVHQEKIDTSRLNSLYVYDEGFGGYSVQLSLPIPSFPTGRLDKERAEAHLLTQQLQAALVHKPLLAPPLTFFENACQQAHVDFASTFVQFLMAWHQNPHFLFMPIHPLPPILESVLQQMDWQTIPVQDQQVCQWTRHLLTQLETSQKRGEAPLDVLQKYRWPFLKELQQAAQSQENFPLNVLAQQICSLSDHLPLLEKFELLSLQDHACLLSAYLRAYGIDYRSLMPLQEDEPEQFAALEAYWKEQNTSPVEYEQALLLETPLTTYISPENPPLKLEEHCPGIIVEVQQGQHKQILTLAYDPHSTGLKWPILGGNYLIRFQPQLQELPYRVRLRQARQILYPHSTQTYSYECDVLITEKEKSAAAQTLSMNHVYETWDGYRFYLAGISTGSSQDIKHIQLVVNYDPVKYMLTYPGALFVFMGIILLFWLRPYRNKKTP